MAASDSWPSHVHERGFFCDFEPIRTASGPSRRVTRRWRLHETAPPRRRLHDHTRAHARRRRSHAGTLSRDEILTALKEDKRVIGFMRECKEAVLRDLLDPEKIEANLEEVDADKSGEIDMEEWINAARISASRRVVVSSLC